MFKRVISHTEQTLTERLQREALAERPEFSESLDRQIRHRVRQVAAASATPHPRRSARGLQFGWAAVAVAVLVFVTIATAQWWPKRPLTPDTGQQLAGADRPAPQIGAPIEPGYPPAEGPSDDLLALASLPDRALDQVDRLLGSSSVGLAWSDLGHDARLAMEMLFDPLPLELVAGDAVEADGTL